MSKRITVTFTDEEYNQIKEDAERNYRTFNEELRYKLKLLRPGISSTPALHYPEGVRSAENPEGAPIITNNTSDDYDAYYNRPDPSTNQRRKTIIG